MNSNDVQLVYGPPQKADRDRIAAMLADDMTDLGVAQDVNALLTVADLILQDDGYSCFCLVVRAGPEGPPVGLLLANILFSVKLAGKALWVENLFVHSDWRKRGLGRQLVERMLDWAEVNDIKGIDLEAYQGNTPAALLYRSVGFRRLSRERFWFDFRWVETDSGLYDATDKTD